MIRKIKVAVIFIFLIPVLASAQTGIYHPFPTGNAHWVYQYHDEFGIPMPVFPYYDFTGDTLISGMSYKRVLYYGNYARALREDNKVIYFIPDTSSSEVLLYDFNMGLGDTLIHPYGGAVCANDTAIVVQIDSVLASDGYHRRLWFNSFAYWTEGIGAEFYLLNPCNVWCVSGNDFLFCHESDAGVVYPANFISCFVHAPPETYTKDDVSVYPSPASGNTTIQTKTGFGNYTLNVYSAEGLLQADPVEAETEEYLLNCTSFSPGVYLLVMQSRRGDKVTKKLVVTGTR